MGKGKKQLTICLLHCSKAKILWDMLLAIFGVNWVFPLSIKETLLSWHGSFVGKRPRRLGWKHPSAFFGQFGRKEVGSFLRM